MVIAPVVLLTVRMQPFHVPNTESGLYATPPHCQSPSYGATSPLAPLPRTTLGEISVTKSEGHIGRPPPEAVGFASTPARSPVNAVEPKWRDPPRDGLPLICVSGK